MYEMSELNVVFCLVVFVTFTLAAARLHQDYLEKQIFNICGIYPCLIKGSIHIKMWQACTPTLLWLLLLLLNFLKCLNWVTSDPRCEIDLMQSPSGTFPWKVTQHANKHKRPVIIKKKPQQRATWTAVSEGFSQCGADKPQQAIPDQGPTSSGPRLWCNRWSCWPESASCPTGTRFASDHI